MCNPSSCFLHFEVCKPTRVHSCIASRCFCKIHRPKTYQTVNLAPMIVQCWRVTAALGDRCEKSINAAAIDVSLKDFHVLLLKVSCCLICWFGSFSILGLSHSFSQGKGLNVASSTMVYNHSQGRPFFHL